MFRRAKSLFNNFKEQSGYVFNKTMFKMAVAGGLISSAEASTICFEVDNHDHTLITRTGLSADSIFDTLKTNCSAYIDPFSDNCANFFTSIFEYGKGFFGGTSCTLTIHEINTLSPCVDDVLKKQCTTGYGTAEDILSTIGIAIGSVAVCGLACWAASKLPSRTPAPESKEIEAFPYEEIDEEQPGLAVHGMFSSSGKIPVASVGSSNTPKLTM